MKNIPEREKFGVQLSTLPALTAFEPIYSALGACPGAPGLEAGSCYTPKVAEFTNAYICKRKRKQ